MGDATARPETENQPQEGEMFGLGIIGTILLILLILWLLGLI
jgi:hypothetical protein